MPPNDSEGFRLTIRNVNFTEYQLAVLDMQRFRLTIRNVNWEIEYLDEE